MIGIGLVETVEHPYPRPYLQLQQPISVPMLMELRFEVFEIIDLLVVCDYLCLVKEAEHRAHSSQADRANHAQAESEFFGPARLNLHRRPLQTASPA